MSKLSFFRTLVNDLEMEEESSGVKVLNVKLFEDFTDFRSIIAHIDGQICSYGYTLYNPIKLGGDIVRVNYKKL